MLRNLSPLAKAEQGVFDAYPKKMVSNKIEMRVHLWTLSSDAQNQGSQDALPWERIVPRIQYPE